MTEPDAFLRQRADPSKCHDEIRAYTYAEVLELLAAYRAAVPAGDAPPATEAEQRIAVLEQALEADATDLWRVTNSIRDVIRARSWVTESRGSYEWDDQRYRDETRYAFNEVRKLIEDVQPPASKRFLTVMSKPQPATVDAPPANQTEDSHVTNERLAEREHATVGRAMGAGVAGAGVSDLDSDSGRVGSVQGTSARDKSGVAATVDAQAALRAALKAIVDQCDIDGTGMRYTFDYNSPLGKQARAALAAADASEKE